jgi:hypothetical protein
VCAAHQDFATGSSPDGVVVRDFNDDGFQDLAVSNKNSATVSVLVQISGSGSTMLDFQPRSNIPVASAPSGLTAADLNGDGKPDLVVAAAGANAASVLINTTEAGALTATFNAHQDFGTGATPVATALADFNGGGQLDLATVNQGAGSASVLLNTTVIGAPGVVPVFPPSPTQQVGNAPSALPLADLNFSSILDPITANLSDNTISVGINGSGPGGPINFGLPPQNFAVGAKPSAVATGDLNGDGSPDVVVANAGADTVSVLLDTTPPGFLTVSFTPQQAFATGKSPDNVALADINNDGKLDIVVGNQADNTISVLLNTTAPGAATPSFAAAQTFASGNDPVALAIADVNHDGKPDVIAVDQADNQVSVLLNTTAPGAAVASFAAPQTFAVGASPAAVAVGDVNGDGLPDLVVANSGAATVSVLLNTTAPGAATASFAAQQTLATGVLPTSVVLGDVIGNGKQDLVVANGSDNTVSLLPNTTPAGASTISFAAQQTFATGKFPRALALGPIGRTGRLDVGVVNQTDATFSGLNNTPVLIIGDLATGTIVQTPPTVQFSVSNESVNANAGTFSISLTLSQASTVATTIPFTLGGSAVAGTDFSAVTPSPLTIPAGQTSATITGTLLNNTAGSRTLVITLGTPTTATVGSVPTNTLTIVGTTTTVPVPVFTALSFNAASARFSGRLGAGSLAATGVITVTITGPGLSRPLVLSAPLDANGGFSIVVPTAALQKALAQSNGSAARTFRLVFSYGGDTNFQPASLSEPFVVALVSRLRFPHGRQLRVGTRFQVTLQVTTDQGVNLTSPQQRVHAVALVSPDGPHFGPHRVGNVYKNQFFVFDRHSAAFLFAFGTAGLSKGTFVFGYRISSDPSLRTLTFTLV